MNRFFEKALPIWPTGREKEMNLTVGFRTILSGQHDTEAVLRIAASTIYRVSVNGHFIGHGPARGPHGFYRVDEWALNRFLTEERNIIAIEVNGANVNSYYTLDQPSFVQAEVRSGDNILASSHDSEGDFEAIVLRQRVQKVQRYSYQRTFVEYYRMNSKRMTGSSTPMKACRLKLVKSLNRKCSLAEAFLTQSSVFCPRNVFYSLENLCHLSRIPS
ncbi:hypothetical protein [Paenibacillus phytohabitans]|uniref:hypothetical protein n=1 Tax=Paenibacillus phytohabitans TaxID=2654978 RepID=UPI00300B10F8